MKTTKKKITARKAVRKNNKTEQANQQAATENKIPSTFEYQPQTPGFDGGIVVNSNAPIEEIGPAIFRHGFNAGLKAANEIALSKFGGESPVSDVLANNPMPKDAYMEGLKAFAEPGEQAGAVYTMGVLRASRDIVAAAILRHVDRLEIHATNDPKEAGFTGNPYQADGSN